MKLKIKCTNVYSDDEIVNVQDVDVPAPEEDAEGRCEHGHFLAGGVGICPMPLAEHALDADELQDWAQDELLQFTGTGRSGHATYIVEVLECAERPALVGFETSAEG